MVRTGAAGDLCVASPAQKATHDGVRTNGPASPAPRLVRKLQQALGDQICVALEDTSVVKIMLNPNGRLIIMRLATESQRSTI